MTGAAKRGEWRERSGIRKKSARSEGELGQRPRPKKRCGKRGKSKPTEPPDAQFSHDPSKSLFRDHKHQNFKDPCVRPLAGLFSRATPACLEQAKLPCVTCSCERAHIHTRVRLRPSRVNTRSLLTPYYLDETIFDVKHDRRRPSVPTLRAHTSQFSCHRRTVSQVRDPGDASPCHHHLSFRCRPRFESICLGAGLPA